MPTTTLPLNDTLLVSLEPFVSASVMSTLLHCGNSMRFNKWESAEIVVHGANEWTAPRRGSSSGAFSLLLGLTHSETEINSQYVYFNDPRAAAFMHNIPPWWTRGGTTHSWHMTRNSAIIFPSDLQFFTLAHLDAPQRRTFLLASFSLQIDGLSKESSLTECMDRLFSPQQIGVESLLFRWPVPVYRTRLPLSVGALQSLEGTILGMEAGEHSVRKSNKVCTPYLQAYTVDHFQGGWQSRTTFFEHSDEGVAQIRTTIYSHITEYLQSDLFASTELALPKTGTLEIEINHAWACVNRRSDLNAPHVHPMAEVSSVVYINAGHTEGHLHLVDPRATRATYAANSTLMAPTTVRTRAGAARLVLFPSWLEHYVDPHTTEEPRIAIAFNARVRHVQAENDSSRLHFKIPHRHSP
jgi:uncharacterized protein (TIGR02466 family)